MPTLGHFACRFRRRNREAADRLAGSDQRRPKGRKPPSGKATPPRGRSDAHPFRRAAGTGTEGPEHPGAKGLAVLAQTTWAAAHDGAECPPNRIPTPHDMATWWPWPEDLRADLRDDLARYAGPDPLTVETLVPELKTDVVDAPLTHVDVAAAQTTFRCRPGSAALGDALWPATAPRGDGGRWAQRHGPPVGYRCGAANHHAG